MQRANVPSPARRTTTAERRRTQKAEVGESGSSLCPSLRISSLGARTSTRFPLSLMMWVAAAGRKSRQGERRILFTCVCVRVCVCVCVCVCVRIETSIRGVLLCVPLSRQGSRPRCWGPLLTEAKDSSPQRGTPPAVVLGPVVRRGESQCRAVEK